MDLFFGAFLLHDHLIQNRGNQGCVDFALETQLLLQLLTDAIDIQFPGACLGLFLSDGRQLGFPGLQLIVQPIITFFEFFRGDGSGNVQVQKPILFLLGGCFPMWKGKASARSPPLWALESGPRSKN